MNVLGFFHGAGPARDHGPPYTACTAHMAYTEARRGTSRRTDVHRRTRHTRRARRTRRTQRRTACTEQGRQPQHARHRQRTRHGQAGDREEHLHLRGELPARQGRGVGGPVSGRPEYAAGRAPRRDVRPLDRPHPRPRLPGCRHRRPGPRPVLPRVLHRGPRRRRLGRARPPHQPGAGQGPLAADRAAAAVGADGPAAARRGRRGGRLHRPPAARVPFARPGPADDAGRPPPRRPGRGARRPHPLVRRIPRHRPRTARRDGPGTFRRRAATRARR